MLIRRVIIAGVVMLLAGGCAHSTDSTGDASRGRRVERLPYDAPEDGSRAECSTVGARINALIAKGSSPRRRH